MASQAGIVLILYIYDGGLRRCAIDPSVTMGFQFQLLPKKESF
jgi:hypothetical protein